MGFVSRIPSNIDELHEHLMKLFEGRSHINSVKVNPSTMHIEVDLDWTANKVGGVEDFKIPLRANKLNEANTQVAHLRREFEAGHPPSRSISVQLFECISTRN
jgi:hypothetical protein